MSVILTYDVRGVLHLRQRVSFKSSLCLSHRLKFQPNPTLRYLYPPPSNSILTNITHALMSVPKFYVQVSKYCFFCTISFFCQYMLVFDMQTLFICVCICRFVSSHIVPMFILCCFWEVCVYTENANVSAFLAFRFRL